MRRRKKREKKRPKQRRIIPERKFTYSMRRKLMIFFIIIVAVFALLGVRIIYINMSSGDEYKRQVLAQQSFESTTLPYKRGRIVDRQGTVLADSQMVYNVIVDAKQILEEDYYMEPTLDALESLGIDREEVSDYIQEHPNSQYYIALKNLPYQDKTDYEDRVESGIQQEEADEIKVKDRVYDNIKGIWFEDSYIRTYPKNTLAADVIGFANQSNVGTGGLEEYYNDTLNGTEGRTYGYLDASSDVETRTIAAQDGDNLVLTLDANLQQIVEEELESFNENLENNYRTGNGSNNTGCIIMNINTGEILAMASYPGFDLNDPQNTDALVGMPKLDDTDTATDEYLTNEDVEDLNEEDVSRYLNALWTNFCISSYYEPGSVAKPFTVSAGLETGTVDPNETFYCPGYKVVDGARIYCHDTEGHGTVTVSQAVEESCNVALMDMGLEIGAENFSKFQNIFNFGLRTNIDLADEARTDQFLYDPEDMSDTDLATNAFGQNFDVTMIQMISAFSSVINGGNYYQPHLVSQITSASGAVVRNIEPQVLKHTVSEQTSARLRSYCEQVVEGTNGTGHSARPYGYRIGGKTGTGETLPRRNGEYVLSFEGYAPADDPQIAIYVVVDRPNVASQDDASLATRLTRSILQRALPYLGIPMTEDLTEEEAAELDAEGISYTADVISEETETGTDETDSNGTDSDGTDSNENDSDGTDLNGTDSEGTDLNKTDSPQG